MTDNTIPMTPLEVADHLDAAADVILDRGLVRGTWQDSKGSVCSNEAIAQALKSVQDGTYRSSASMNTLCLPTVKALALYLAGRFVPSDVLTKKLNMPSVSAALANAAADPASFIIRVNDHSDTDMSEGMRNAAKYLREVAGREAA